MLHCRCWRFVARLRGKHSALVCFARRLWVDEAGITALKFNLVFLAILVAIAGTIEMGRLLITPSTLAHAVSDESRNSPGGIASSQGEADRAATVQRISLNPRSPSHDAQPRPQRMP